MSQQDILLWAVRQTSIGNATYSKKGSCKSHGSLKFVLNVLMMDVNTLCPPFLLNLVILNFNVHNFLFYYGALVNVIPLSAAKKINFKWDKKYAQIIPLDRERV